MDGLPLVPPTSPGTPGEWEEPKRPTERPVNVDTAETMVFLEATQLALEIADMPPPVAYPDCPDVPPPLHRTSKAPEQDQQQVAPAEEMRPEAMETEQVESPPPLETGEAEIPPTQPEIPPTQPDHPEVSPIKDRALRNNLVFFSAIQTFKTKFLMDFPLPLTSESPGVCKVHPPSRSRSAKTIS